MTPATRHPAPYVVLAVLLVGACAPLAVPPPAIEVPRELLGSFEDDYGNRFRITHDLWLHEPESRYVIERWVPEEEYLLAQNHPENTSDGGLWTRIDWVQLPEMQPWTWGFCLTAYDADSLTAAEAAAAADRSDLMTGCAGFPFSRMKRSGSG